MLKNMEFGVRQNRFKPSPSDSKTRAFVHKEIEKYLPPIAYILFPILLIL